MYIDARNEKFQLGNVQQIIYVIDSADEDPIKRKIYDAVGPYVLKIEVVPANKKVIISYYEKKISPSFMEYRFEIKGLIFKRNNDYIFGFK